MKYAASVWLICLFIAVRANAQQKKVVVISDRQTGLNCLEKVARPVRQNLAADRLKGKMPQVLSPGIDNAANRSKVMYPEAFARAFSGVAPWLNTEGGTKEETALRKQYRKRLIKAPGNAVNPSAKDYTKRDGGQPLDALFLAFGLMRCPLARQPMNDEQKGFVVTAFLTARNTVPSYPNRLLFSGRVEAFFLRYNLPCDAVRLDSGIRESSQHWYTGDGLFSDGVNFHLDYHNSYVIQSFLAVVLETVQQKSNGYAVPAYNVPV